MKQIKCVRVSLYHSWRRIFPPKQQKSTRFFTLIATKIHGISSHSTKETTQNIGSTHCQNGTITISWFFGKGFNHLCCHQTFNGSHQTQENSLDHNFGDAIARQNAGEIIASAGKNSCEIWMACLWECSGRLGKCQLPLCWRFFRVDDCQVNCSINGKLGKMIIPVIIPLKSTPNKKTHGCLG